MSLSDKVLLLININYLFVFRDSSRLSKFEKLLHQMYIIDINICVNDKLSDSYQEGLITVPPLRFTIR